MAEQFGFSDLSPLDVDRILEDEIHAKIIKPLTSPDNDRRLPVVDAMKVAEEIDSPTKPKARLLRGGIIYIPPEYIREMRRNKYRQLSDELRGEYVLRGKVEMPLNLTQCSYCGLHLKKTRLRKHLRRCPKYSKKHGSSAR